MNLTIPFIVLAIMFVAVVIGWSETWKTKEHYRCRVFDLTDGKEGGNLLKIVPATPPPPAPKKPNSDEVEDENVNRVIERFDFERARSIMVLKARGIGHVPTIDEMKKKAKRLLLVCMEHQDRKFWWAGGMHRGGICATFDSKWGLSLMYIDGVARVEIQQPASEQHVLPPLKATAD